MIIAGFDGAWQSLHADDSNLARPDCSEAARDVLAKRIIDRATAGILDPEALKDDAVAYLQQQLPQR